MICVAQSDKTLLFHRIRFAVFFVTGLFVSFGVPFVERFVGTAPQYLFPVRVLICPLFFAALIEFTPVFKQAKEKISRPTLWFNAIYIVGIGMAVLWIAQVASLLFGARNLANVNFAAMLNANFVLLLWAVLAVVLCRVVLGRMAGLFAGDLLMRGRKK